MLNNTHPLYLRSVDAGNFLSNSKDRVGLGTKPPPQLGHVPLCVVVLQALQNVHSNEQICAPL